MSGTKPVLPQLKTAWAWPDFTSKAEFLAAVAALEAGGVNEFAFYNWGHIRRANLAWIGEAMHQGG